MRAELCDLCVWDSRESSDEREKLAATSSTGTSADRAVNVKLKVWIGCLERRDSNTKQNQNGQFDLINFIPHDSLYVQT